MSRVSLGSAIGATLVPLAAAAALSAPALGAVQPAKPITATGPEPTVPAYVSAPATPHPVAAARPAWQSAVMAPNPKNSVHNDAWQSDAYTAFGGPLGRSPEVFSTEIGRTCITLVFDSKGRLIGSCIKIGVGPGLYLLDPRTLDTLAFAELPYVPPPASVNPATN